ncbi:hypothetical protein [Variovorax paradoxus]|uniref:hypothetical protein n=1 Tax=Variovorax paradoxus TaxID=34073 RepID=UPI001ABC1F5B
MARSRNLKPGLYKNEDLAECDVWARYIFPGLWTMADREGRLEDRPKRIKGELLPYDSVEVEPLLEELERHGFIARYEIDGQRLIQILAFHRHQNPHKKEQASKLPPPAGFVPGKPAAGDDLGTVEPEARGAISEAEAGGMFGARAESGGTKALDMHSASTGHAPGLGVMEGGVCPADSLYSDSLYSDSLSFCAEPATGSSAAAPPPDPVVVLIPLVNGTDFAVTPADVREWEAAYPSVDVLAELLKARIWCRDNPTRRKTEKGVRRFLSGWIGKEQDRGGSKRVAAPSQPYGSSDRKPWEGAR